MSPIIKHDHVAQFVDKDMRRQYLKFMKPELVTTKDDYKKQKKELLQKQNCKLELDLHIVRSLNLDRIDNSVSSEEKN
jgi:hypothetical protein